MPIGPVNEALCPYPLVARIDAPWLWPKAVAAIASTINTDSKVFILGRGFASLYELLPANVCPRRALEHPKGLRNRVHPELQSCGSRGDTIGISGNLHRAGPAASTASRLPNLTKQLQLDDRQHPRCETRKALRPVQEGLDIARRHTSRDTAEDFTVKLQPQESLNSRCKACKTSSAFRQRLRITHRAGISLLPDQTKQRQLDELPRSRLQPRKPGRAPVRCQSLDIARRHFRVAPTALWPHR